MKGREITLHALGRGLGGGRILSSKGGSSQKQQQNIWNCQSNSGKRATGAQGKHVIPRQKNRARGVWEKEKKGAASAEREGEVWGGVNRTAGQEARSAREGVTGGDSLPEEPSILFIPLALGHDKSRQGSATGKGGGMLGP